MPSVAFAHSVFDIAVELHEPQMRMVLDAAFASAQAAGRFANTNASEYWPEGGQSWFDTNIASVPPNGIHNESHTRAQLNVYAPELRR